MPITEKEALEVFGATDLSKFEDTDAFKAAIEKDWVKKAQAVKDPDVRRNILSGLNRVMKKRLSEVASSMDVTLDKEVLDGEDPLDIASVLVESAKEKFAGLDELKKKAEKAVPDDVLNDYKTKIAEAEKKINTFQKSAKEIQEKYDALIAEGTKKDRAAKIDGVWKEALGGIPFHQGVDELKRKGFIADLKDRYRVEIDENGNPYTADSIKGEPVKHPKKAGELWSLSEIAKEEAKKNKLVSENPHAGKPVVQGSRTITMSQEAPEKGVRPIAQPMWQGRVK